MSLVVKSKTSDVVKCEVIDGGELKSRRHLNVRGKSATLPSITGLFQFLESHLPQYFMYSFFLLRKRFSLIFSCILYRERLG